MACCEISTEYPASYAHAQNRRTNTQIAQILDRLHMLWAKFCSTVVLEYQGRHQAAISPQRVPVFSHCSQLALPLSYPHNKGTVHQRCKSVNECSLSRFNGMNVKVRYESGENRNELVCWELHGWTGFKTGISKYLRQEKDTPCSRTMAKAVKLWSWWCHKAAVWIEVPAWIERFRVFAPNLHELRIRGYINLMLCVRLTSSLRIIVISDHSRKSLWCTWTSGSFLSEIAGSTSSRSASRAFLGIPDHRRSFS